MPQKRTVPPVAKRLKELREARDITQTQLGIEIGLDPSIASSRMNRYEHGMHQPYYSTVKKIAEYFGVPTFYFYVEDEYLEEIKKLFKIDI